jgi:hypothetical protein
MEMLSMSWKKRIIGLLVIMTVWFSSSAQAQRDLLFDGGAPDRNSGLRISDIGFVASAADFQIAKESLVTSAEFWSVEFPGQFVWDGTLNYFVFEDDDGMPSENHIYNGLAQSIVKTFDPDVNTIYFGFKYSFNFQVPLELEAGTIYWLALNLGGGGTFDTTQAFWSATWSRFSSNAMISHSFPWWIGYHFDLAFRLYGPEIVPVEIDIKPGNLPNSINLKSKGKVPVAILTTDDFDAYDVDPVSCIFAGAYPVRWNIEDLDYDGDDDIIFHFETQELVLNQESTEASLKCETYDSLPITGTDSVNIVPKGKSNKKKNKLKKLSKCMKAGSANCSAF